jgi:hypothetical protein
MCHEIKNFLKLVDIASVVERGMRESFTAYELKSCTCSVAGDIPIQTTCT